MASFLICLLDIWPLSRVELRRIECVRVLVEVDWERRVFWLPARARLSCSLRKAAILAFSSGSSQISKPIIFSLRKCLVIHLKRILAITYRTGFHGSLFEHLNQTRSEREVPQFPAKLIKKFKNNTIGTLQINVIKALRVPNKQRRGWVASHRCHCCR